MLILFAIKKNKSIFEQTILANTFNKKLITTQKISKKHKN